MPNYVPGGSDNLVKAKLKAEEAPNTEIEVYFNPKEITIDKPVPWQKHKNVEGNEPTLEFTAAEPKAFSCELMFDLFEQRGNVQETYITPLETLTLIVDDLGRPPMCTFTWGNGGIPVFRGVVASLNVKYTLFLPTGIPCRATVNLKMTQAAELLNKTQAEERTKAEAEAAKNKTTADPAHSSTSSPQARQGMANNDAAGQPTGRTGAPTTAT